MKKRPHSNSIWITKFTDGPYQQVCLYDECEVDDIRIAFFPGNKQHGASFVISRKDARLLARRINQCLDATVKK